MTFRDTISAHIRDAEQKPLTHYAGGDWWQIWPEERFVFDIEEERWPRMMTAYSAYEVLLDIVAPEDFDYEPAEVENERAAQASIVNKGHCVDGFQHFAALFAGLTFREAAAAYDKMGYSEVREGVTQYLDEIPPSPRQQPS